MQPEKAHAIVDKLNNGPASPFGRRDKRRTSVQEITDSGNIVYRQGLGTLKEAKDPTRKPGEYVVITSVNSGIGHKLGALAELGYLSDGATTKDPNSTDPQLELVSHTSGPGILSEAVFKDHNPKA